MRWGSWFRALERHQQRYGDVFQIQILSPRSRRDGGRWPFVRRTCVVYSTPDHIREIFALPGDVLRAGEAREPLERFLGRRALPVLDGVDHRNERREMLSLFSSDRLHRLEQTMARASARAIDRWGSPAGTDLWALIRATVEEVNLAAALARRPDEAARLIRAGHRARWAFMVRLFVRTAVGASFERRAAADEGRQALRAIVMRRLDEIRACPHMAETSLLDMLLESTPTPTAAELEVLIDRLITLGAGMESTIAGVAWTCLHLLRTPQALSRVCEEVRAAPPDVVPGPDSYLDAACKEALRLHPPFPIVVRRVARPVCLGGFALAPDTLVVGSLYLLHRRPELFPEPDAFRPERFRELAVRPDTYLPFGAGARHCPGQAMAVRQMRVVLATIFRRFDVELEGVASVRTARQTTTLVPSAHAARVRVRPRIGSAATV